MGIGVALAGGGLKAVAHIGAIKALEDINVKIDYISGTSSGSIIAALYAMGFKTEEISEITKQYYGILTNFSKLPIIGAASTYIIYKKVKLGGLTSGEKIEKLVNEVASKKGIKNISDLKIPFACATADTISTKECIFVSKHYELPKYDDVDYIFDAPIGKAIRSSMAFPGIFTTSDFPPYNFIDGGTKDNLPVRILKDMGVKNVLALAFKLDDYEPHDNIMEILLRTCDIFSLKDVIAAERLADLALEIDAKGTSLLTIDDMNKCYTAGYKTIIDNKGKILSIAEKEYCK
jgi:NTE family protein